MSKGITFCSLVVASILISCGKVETPIPGENNNSGVNCEGPVVILEECVGFANGDSATGISTSTDLLPEFETPCFDLTNGSMMIYFQRNANSNYHIRKFDISTGVSSIVVENTDVLEGLAISPEPVWATNDCILFDDFDGTNRHIWRINSDGSNLVQLTSLGSNSSPEPSTAENKFICYSLEAGSSRIYDSNGNFITDVVNSLTPGPYLRKAAWYEDMICYLATSGTGVPVAFCLHDVGNGEFTEVWPVPNGSQIDDIEWIPDCDKVVWTDYYSGLFILDLESLVLTQIRENCETRTYASVSVSSDGQKILAQRIDRYLEIVDGGDGVVHNNSVIVLMNIDGSEEEVLPLE